MSANSAQQVTLKNTVPGKLSCFRGYGQELAVSFIILKLEETITKSDRSKRNMN